MRNRNPLQLNSKNRGPRYVYDRPRARLVGNLLRGAVLVLAALICVAVVIAPRIFDFSFGTPGLPVVSLVTTATETATPPPTARPSNTPAPTATTGPSVTPTLQPTKQYTVVEGDSLFSIALTNGISIQQLAAANGKLSDTLAVGEVLNIPSPDYELPTSTPFPVGLAPGTELQHVITPGQTLGEIADAYLTTVEAILADNDFLIDAGPPPPGVTIVVRYGIITPTPLLPAASETPAA